VKTPPVEVTMKLLLFVSVEVITLVLEEERNFRQSPGTSAVQLRVLFFKTKSATTHALNQKK